MADKKFKTGVDIQSSLTLSSASNGQRALILNGSKELVESSVTQTEIERLSGITSALLESGDKGVANGVASLDGNGKVPSAQLPALAITCISNYGSICCCYYCCKRRINCWRW